MSVNKLASAAVIALSTAFSSPAMAVEPCDQDFINTKKMTEQLLNFYPRDWNTQVIASYGPNAIDDIAANIGKRNYPGLVDDVFQDLDRLVQRNRPINWDTIRAKASYAIWPVLDELEAQPRLTESSLRVALPKAHNLMAEYLDTADAVLAQASVLAKAPAQGCLVKRDAISPVGP